jgi:hypothetical protein
VIEVEVAGVRDVRDVGGVRGVRAVGDTVSGSAGEVVAY